MSIKKDKKGGNKIKSKTRLRTHRETIAFNDDEYKVIRRYFSKYKISNKSRFYREAIMTSVIQRLVGKDYPTLFSEDEMQG
jgi:hypothetical protein